MPSGPSLDASPLQIRLDVRMPTRFWNETMNLRTRAVLCLCFVSGLCADPDGWSSIALSQDTAPPASQATRVQDTVPRVARLEMKLTLGEKVIDVIQKGDLLTVLNERSDSYVIQTFSGQKGAVAKVNAVPISESVPIYDDLISEHADEGRLYTLRASAHWSAGNAETALADYDKAIELGYTEAHAYASRGLFHLAMKNHDLAIQDFTTALEKDEEDEVPLLNRASVYLSKGEFDKAIQDYSAAIKLRPANPILYSQRAVAHKLAGELDAAVSDYDKTLELVEKDVSAMMGRGFIKFQQGKHEEAIADLSRVIEISPQTAVAYNNRGYNYQSLGKHDLALKDFTRAVELAPRYLLALQNKAWILTVCEDASLRDPVQAIKDATAICEISQYKDVSDLTLLAAAHAAAGEFETAIGWQEKAQELSNEAQKEIGERILDLYAQEKPLDPKLLEAPEPQSNASSTGTKSTQAESAAKS